jgi:8-oxo-dGTP diphosphatase
LFTVRDRRLLIALQERGGCQSLPRREPTCNESLDAAAMHILDDEIGTGERYREQLYSISHGSEGDWTVTVTYLALAPTGAAESSTNSTAWFSPSGPAGLPHLDRKIVDYALVHLRAKLGYTAIAFHLLPSSFTLSEVHTVYVAVLGREVDKRNFRRRIHATGLLEGTGESRREGSHRPARLYRLRRIDHAETYLTPTWAAQPELKAAYR